MKYRALLNLIAILFLGIGAVLSLLPPMQVTPELAGALWGALIAWVASARFNGQSSASP